MSTLGNRLRKLRISHSILAKEMAIILKMQYRNYQRYEKNEIDLPMSKIKAISDMFGVSSDWLLCRTEIPYNNDVLCELEASCGIGTSNTFGIELGVLLPNDYLDKESRVKNYSLSIRANILTIMLMECYLHIYPELNSNFWSTISNVNLLNAIFSGQSTKPVFDINKEL